MSNDKKPNLPSPPPAKVFMVAGLVAVLWFALGALVTYDFLKKQCTKPSACCFTPKPTIVK